MDFIFAEDITDTVKADISSWITAKLTEISGEANATLVEYISAMIDNKKTMGDMRTDLLDFLAESECDTFIEG